jgi:hypothetical protein
VDLSESQIRRIDFLATSGQGTAASDRLHGTVRTRQGDFTGFIQWNRQNGVGSDEFKGRVAENEIRLGFDTIQSIARHSRNSSQVKMLDGKEIILIDIRDDVGIGNRGVYVDDRRYGRVLISWDAFERVDFSPGGGGPAYGDFPTGRPLTGDVITRDGRRLAGRLVYDLDESEITETLDAPFQGVDYHILFGLIASIELPGRVTLHSGEVLQLERSGDLGDRNIGLLVFVEGRKQPEYVRWADIQQIRFDRPPAMYPPMDVR